MRLNNLTKAASERIKRGDIKYLQQVLSEELEQLKDDMIFLPEIKVSELRGKAVTLVTILNLLPK